LRGASARPKRTWWRMMSLTRCRASVVGRGRYRLHLEAFSESTKWRCLHWRHVRAQWERRYPFVP
jgi:hypothetical protein